MVTSSFFIAGVVGGLSVANGVTTVRLWRSELVGRRQRVAQTLLMWFLPGSFAFVNYFLRDALEKERDQRAMDDSTVDNSTPYINGA